MLVVPRCVVKDSGARLLSRMTMFPIGFTPPLVLQTLSMLLKASGLKQRWLDTLQLADMALGP